MSLVHSRIVTLNSWWRIFDEKMSAHIVHFNFRTVIEINMRHVLCKNYVIFIIDIYIYIYLMINVV